MEQKTKYNIVAATSESTVVTEYIPEARQQTGYQGEAELERDFIKRLCEQGYEFIRVADESALISNLRFQIERLNDYKFYDSEWERLCNEYLINQKEGILEKTRKVQIDERHSFRLDNGITKNIAIIDKRNIHNNHLQVLNQYEEGGGSHATRYDVTILVNGLPLVHIELKRRGVDIKEAFNQINRYQRDSFWVNSGLYEYIQVFVISNGTQTKYYSNTTRDRHCEETKSENARRKSKKTSNSFEFTSYWADAKNKVISDLVDFTKTFFAKHTILNILTKYCVFTSEDLLLVMRPYQIVATERILNKIEISSNYKQTGTPAAGGYIWHTTGSGKTLTSFKTAQLATSLSYIDKVLFVVDRKDLDYQTMKEYDRFEKGAANGNTSTSILKKQLENPSARIIITTIQKLANFVSKYKGHEIFKKHIVMIFDECHRSQFGEMHKDITGAFKNYHLFGFTGTPIFAANAGSGKNPKLKTTVQAFGCYLHGDSRNCANEPHQTAMHTYTIVDAINDKNVLGFRIDYINTVKVDSGGIDIKVKAIDIEKALLSEERIAEVTKYILEHFDQKTYRNQERSEYTHKAIENIVAMATSKHNTVAEKKRSIRVNGFNSIFAVSSIAAAKLYYDEFKKQLAEIGRELKIATIFSYSANEDDVEEGFVDEDFDNSKLDDQSRDFLERAIKDYNKLWTPATSYDTSSDKFQNYYKDVSMRVKNRELDILIVVNMFLTGFDATTLNTLWVDKNLRQHGLIQAFSRTNRILNSVKGFGNIVCFRDLEEATNSALALFGDPETSGIVLLKSYNDYYNGYEENGKQELGYKTIVGMLLSQYPLGTQIIGEQAQKGFIRLFGQMLKRRNILTAFDEFAGNEILSARDLQDYTSIYLDLHREFTSGKSSEKENINDDIIFEIELVKQIEVNIDYILMLVAKYHASNCKNEDILRDIDKAIGSSPELRSKRELIENFIEQINVNTKIDEDWRTFVKKQKEKELEEIIKDEKLKPVETRAFIEGAFRDGVMKDKGTDIDKILPPVSRFDGGGRTEKKQGIIARLLKFFERFVGLA